jgi:putative PIN family toxin of toxin-antitoxin system
MRVVIDTNVLISAFFWGGTPRRVLEHAIAGELSVITSRDLIAELERVLAQDFGLGADDLAETIRTVLSFSEVSAAPDAEVEAIRDPGDVMVLTCAAAGGADFIVTGDKDLLVLGHTGRVPIISARTLIEALDAEP